MEAKRVVVAMVAFFMEDFIVDGVLVCFCTMVVVSMFRWFLYLLRADVSVFASMICAGRKRLG